MKTTTQNCTVEFKAIEIEDAIIASELMNELALAINKSRKVTEENSLHYLIVLTEVENLYNMLSNLGFYSHTKIEEK